MRHSALLTLAVLLMVARPPQAQASTTPTWQHCTLHLDWSTMTRVVRSQCHTYQITRATDPVVGQRAWTTYRSPHVRERILFPRFAQPTPVGEVRSYLVTAYSYTPQCGDVNGTTADGSAPIPGYTVASWDPSLWHRHIYVPSLGFHGYVQDRGAPLDLFYPSCGAADAVGRSIRTVIVY